MSILTNIKTIEQPQQLEPTQSFQSFLRRWSSVIIGSAAVVFICGGFLGLGFGWASVHAQIIAENNPPRFDPIESQIVDEGKKASFSVSASDADGDMLIYSVTDFPSGATFTQKSFEGRIFYLFEWTPTLEQSGYYSVRFFVEDEAEEKVLEVVGITVRDVSPEGDFVSPFISNVALVSVTENSATISWSTNEPATGKIEYGISEDYGRSTSFTTDFARDSRQTIDGLKPRTLYRYRVIAKDESGNESFSGTKTFSTVSSEIIAEGEIRGKIIEGALLREMGDDSIFVIKNNKKVHIASPQVFAERGYKWDDVIEVDYSISRDYPISRGFVRVKNDTRVYQIVNGSKRHVPSLEAFSRLGLDWKDVVEVSASEIDLYPRFYLARVEGSEAVYYITKGGHKKWIQTLEIFESYNNKWQDVVVVSQEDLDVYVDVALIRLAGSDRVYKLEGNTKRWIKTQSTFNKLGYGWDEILNINKTEFDFYSEESPIEL